MDGAYNKNDALEIILNDPSAKPCNLSLDYLRYITNNFSSERELGRGGFGVVYKGILRNWEMVAVKNLLPTLQFQEKQFKSEIDNLMRVRNENIVRFVGYCYETQHEYIEYNGKHVFAAKPKMLLCFEYMPNGSLCKYISEESHGLDWQKRHKIIMGICCGLYYLHNECQINGSVIHLDLKPENILLDDNMVPKIADFGLAKLLDDRNTHACVTTFVGSRYYMAPEYILQGIISRKADIYSLGVIMIQIITGHRVSPFDEVSLCQDFVELAVNKWRNRLEAAPSETDCKQIKSCLEIGLSCIKIQRNERPTIKEIIKKLSILESKVPLDNNISVIPSRSTYLQSPMSVFLDDSSGLLQNTEENDPTTRTFVKVYKSGSVGRFLDITQFFNYAELREELVQMFGIKGHLDDPDRSGWQLVFADRENDMLLLGEDPWESFVNSVWYIKILSPEDVHKMGKPGNYPRYLS